MYRGDKAFPSDRQHEIGFPDDTVNNSKSSENSNEYFSYSYREYMRSIWELQIYHN